MNMNKRLAAYLRSLGLAEDATDGDAWDFYAGLRGVQRSIANCLNYVENDQQARTNCDLAIRSLGYDPADPAKLLDRGDGGEPARLLAVDTLRTSNGDDGASTAGDVERARREGQEFERNRRREIERFALVAGASEELTQRLLNEGVDVETARESIYREHEQRSRANVTPDLPGGGGGRAPAAHARNSVTGFTREHLEAAMLHARGLDPTQHWAQNRGGIPMFRTALSDAHNRAIDEGYEYASASLENLVRMCARLDGVTLPGGRNGLLESYLRAGVSTSALSAVFTTSVNAELLAAFTTEEDSTTGGWVRDNDVGDFRPNERARMKQGGKLKKLPRGSEADHTEYEDTVETFKIARYASQFVIDDQDVQDDNFGGISGFVPRDMGVAAAHLRPDLIYAAILANAVMRDAKALFHADHNNLNASAALAIGTLEDAVEKVMLQSESGRTLNIMPRFLIVPPALLFEARTITRSAIVVVAGSTDSVRGQANPVSEENLTIVTDSRLQNGVTDPTDGSGGTTLSGSATTWYLAAMASAHTIEFAYLRGTGRRPQIRPFVLSQGRWGLGWDVKFDVGAKPLSWEGWSKNIA